MKEILSSGVSLFLTEATSGVVMFIFNFIILRISGNIGVAAFGVISVISLVVIAIYTGLSQGIQPMMSSHHGAKNTENVRSVLKYAMLFNILSYMSNKLLGIGNTVASIDELYLFLSNRNCKFSERTGKTVKSR